jgi:hypothetical protein
MPNAAGRIILVCKLKGGADATTTCRELACGRGRRGPAGRACGPGQPGRPHALVEPQDEGADGMNPQLPIAPATTWGRSGVDGCIGSGIPC